MIMNQSKSERRSKRTVLEEGIVWVWSGCGFNRLWY